MSGSFRSTLFMGAAALAVSASQAPATILLCWGEAGERDWAIIKGAKCEDFGGGGALEAACYDLDNALAVPPEGALHNFHPSLDGKGVIGEYGEVKVVAFNDATVIAAIKTEEGEVLYAPLPDGLGLEGEGALMTGSTLGGDEVPLPPMVAFAGERSGVYAEGDFSLYYYVIDVANAAIVNAATADVVLADLDFQPLPAPPIPGDVNLDGVVDSTDLNMVLGDFGCTGGCFGDADGDGDTDSGDLNVVLGGFGTSG